MTTVSMSNIPDLTASVSPPRMVAIEYPLGRTMGAPGDKDGQRTILRDVLQATVEMEEPGNVRHLPYEWPEPKGKARTHPPEPPPITAHMRRHPWQLPRLYSRNVPEEARTEGVTSESGNRG